VPSIKEIADNYEREYGFMAVNATRQNAQMFHSVHADWLNDELKQVHDELLRRDLKVVESEEEYSSLVEQHGIPPAFRKTTQ
jgi:hypothetical protein